MYASDEDPGRSANRMRAFLRCGDGLGLLSGFPSPRKQFGDLADRMIR